MHYSGISMYTYIENREEFFHSWGERKLVRERPTHV